MSENKELIIEEPTVKEKKPAPPKFKTKSCPTIKYIPESGALSFWFDGVFCQFYADKHLDIGDTVLIKYKGELGKGIKFSL